MRRTSMLLKTIFVHYKMVAIFGILNLMHLDFPFLKQFASSLCTSEPLGVLLTL